MFCNSAKQRFDRPYNARDVVVGTDFFCATDDGNATYDALLRELRQASGASSDAANSLYVSWHGDSHVIADDKKMRGAWKKACPTFLKVVKRMETYFGMDIKARLFARLPYPPSPIRNFGRRIFLNRG